MRVIEICSGLGGWSAAFKTAGHKVTTLDIEARFKPDILADVRDDPCPLAFKQFDVALVSPPCRYFSLARACYGYPLKEVGEHVGIAMAAIQLARHHARYIIVENPTGKLRQFIGLPKEKIFLCSYGTPNQKPTDLWGNYPFTLKLPCAPHGPYRDRSDVKSAWRAYAPAEERALLPLALSRAACAGFEAIFGPAKKVKA